MSSEIIDTDNSESSITQSTFVVTSEQPLNIFDEKQVDKVANNDSVTNVTKQKLDVINEVSSSIVDSDKSIIQTPVELVTDKNITKDIDSTNVGDSINDIASDEEIIGTVKQKKNHHFIDSDSEDETTASTDKTKTLERENLISDELQTPQKKKKSRLRSINDDSDSENEIFQIIPEDEPFSINNEISIKKTKQIIESDNEKETIISQKDHNHFKSQRLKQIVDSDSEDEAKLEEKINKESDENIFDEDYLQREQVSRLKNICDSESSAEETENYQPTIKKTRKKNTDISVEKKMTGRDAKEQRRQIKSESQKMVRESRISLPYHRPKQHTLHEFLKRRSRIHEVIDITSNKATTFAIKMSSQELVKAAEQLKQREKEIEEFYKDESDNESDEDITENVECIINNELQKKIFNEEIKSKLEESNNILDKFTKGILDDIDSILETSKKCLNVENVNKEITQKEPTLNLNEDVAEVCLIEDENDDELNESSKIKELRNVLIQFSCGNESNLEQLMEEPEAMDCTSRDAAPENDTINISADTANVTNNSLQAVKDSERIVKDSEKVGVCEQVEVSEKVLKDSEKFVESTKKTVEDSEMFVDSEKNSEVSEYTVEKLENSEKATKLAKETSKTTIDSKILRESNLIVEILNEEKLSEDFIETHFTANFRKIEEIETSKETSNKEDELDKRLKNLNPINSLKKDFKPRLTGDGGDFIVLDEGVERSKRISNLMKRFMIHTSNKSTPKKEVTDEEITIHHQPIIEMDQEPDDVAKKNLTPGLKFKKLRENLQEQIVLKRMEEWKKRQEEMNVETGGIEGEKLECGLEEKVLDDEDEEDISEEESSEDSEEEEDDIVLKDKPKIKSAFVDDEAEVSDEEEMEDDNDILGISDNSEVSEDDSIEDDLIEETTEKKPLKRIINMFDENDSDDVDENEDIQLDEENNVNSSQNEDEITVYQPQSKGLEKTPCKAIIQNNNDISSFITPTLHLTALQGLNSSTKSINESPGIVLSPEPSPLRLHHLLKTKLFTEIEDTNLEEIGNLHSEKLAQTQNFKKCLGDNNLTTQENELLNLCSGKFTGLSTENQRKTPDDLIEDSRKYELAFDNDSLDEKLSEKSTNVLKNSQYSQNSQTTNEKIIKQLDVPLEFRTFNVTKFVIASSDDEEDIETIVKQKKLKKRKKYIIDDISISEDDDRANQDDFSDEEEAMSSEETRNIGYDSEENEVEYEEIDDNEEVNKIATKKAREYFEAEAELSGSDWDSADEDEKGLDDFEAEDGDADKISEKKLQRELGRIHAHTVLEEDKRDVRMLQELLLEDGELHGAGREKKFKWKNADSTNWNDTTVPNEDEDDEEDVENELEWRKMRYERELFLKEQQAKLHPVEEEDFLANDSQIMQLGKEALEKSVSNSNSQQKTTISETILADPDIKLPFTLAHKRGSFLLRSETTLARLAEITSTTSGSLNYGLKKTRNFVFTTVDKTDTIVEELNGKKRKADQGTPKTLKKMRIADSPISARKKMKNKLII